MELQKQAVSELNTQLEEARQEFRAWEKRATSLSRQLKERNSRLEVNLALVSVVY